jgi:hypothetical protein
LGNGLAGEGGGDGLFEIVMLGLGALLAEGDVTVVDAAVVELAEFPSLYEEDGGFGGDGGVGEGDQGLAAVEDGGGGDGEVAAVLLDDGGGVGRVGVDPPEADALGSELLGETGDLRNVAIGDGAIGGGEVEDYDADAGTGEGVDGDAVEIEAVGLGLLCNGWTEAECEGHGGKGADERSNGHRTGLQLPKC